MYARQLKQYLRTVDETFDERTWGFATLVDFLRACQREGVIRLERNRGGGLRVLPGADLARSGTAAGPASEPEANDAVGRQPADLAVAPAPDTRLPILPAGQTDGLINGDTGEPTPAVAESGEDPSPATTAQPTPAARSRRPRRTAGAKPAPRRPSGVKTPGSRKRREQA
jgi:hypothetical protein